jgi:SHS2 domain-containing protein
MSFEELPHTADILVRVRGTTLDELFSESARALMEILYGSSRHGSAVRGISLSTADINSLLIGFLSELLCIAETERFVIARARVSVRGTSLHASLSGEPFSPERHSEGTEVKGISYSGVAIQQEKEGYRVDILFDV